MTKLNAHQLEAAKFFMSSSRSMVVQARAGSGKTSWILFLAKTFKVQMSNTLYIAFTNAAKDELIRREPSIKHQVKTLYQLGLAACKRLIDNKVTVEANKYYHLLDDVLDQEDVKELAKKVNAPIGYNNPYRKELHALINLALVNLVFDRDSIGHFLEREFKVSIAFETLVLYRCISKGIKLCREGEIGFSDMISYPFHGGFSEGQLKMAFDSYSLVFLDEAQDTSTAQLKVVEQIVNGQLVAIGDEFQTIFGFCGATGNSLETIKEKFNAQEFTFPTCYRCGDAILESVHHLVPDITGTGKPSIVERLDDYENAKGCVDPHQNWLVVCRTNAPLVKLAIDYLNEFVPFKFNRSNLEDQLKAKLSYYKSKDSEFESIWESMEVDAKLSIAYRNAKSLDLIDCIKTVLQHNQEIKSWADLRAKIREIFTDNTSTVILGSIHSFKGSEADNVLFFREDLVPFFMAQTRLEIQQEMNLWYVAATRAKSRLVIYTEED